MLDHFLLALFSGRRGVSLISDGGSAGLAMIPALETVAIR
jgi:hypothetical protein